MSELPGGSLMRFARNKYSQNGEDGILCEILKRLDMPEPGHFVEFGVGNGRDLSNTLRLAECGWSGVWIEHNQDSCLKAAELAKQFNGRVTVICGTVGYGEKDNLDAILACLPKFPRTFDFMSIDIDSHDLAVWQSIWKYRSAVVLIEINSGVPLGVEQVHVDGDPEKQGNSFTSMVKLGAEKGYVPVCHTGNLFFVDASLRHRLSLPASELEHPDSLFNDMWSRWAKP